MGFSAKYLAVVCACLLMHASIASNEREQFEQWMQDFKRQAARQGITKKTLNLAFRAVNYDEEIIRLDRQQPEFTQTYGDYISKRVSNTRVQKGVRKLEQHAALLSQIEQRYEVDSYILTAIWGLESDYGDYPMRYDVFNSLTTLAYDPRRSIYFTKELLAALQILQQGHITRPLMKGSYTGALGQPQFMPTVFLQYAQDFNQDGRRDIWHEPADALASIAAYLQKRGAWRSGQNWGMAIELPDEFERASWIDKTQNLRQWRALGLRRVAGDAAALAKLILPAGAQGPAYLVQHNFSAVMKYNPSYYYALSVCLLADKLKAGE